MKTSLRKVTKIIQRYQAKKSKLLAILTDIQTKYNWLPPEAIELVAEKLCVPLIDVYGVASFYHAFSLNPRGKHIATVCSGTACHVRGAPIILDRIQTKLGIEPGCTTKDDQFTLETVNCLGACALAPIVLVDGHYYGQSTPQKVDAIFLQYRKKKKSKKKTNKKTKSVKEMKKKKKAGTKNQPSKNTPKKRSGKKVIKTKTTRKQEKRK